MHATEPRSVLVVDDDAGLRRTLSDILRAKGYRPTTAATGTEALRGLEASLPTVALVDLRLDDMPGLQVVASIKSHSPSTECIVLTGYASQRSAIEAINLGAYSYLVKPIDMEQLLVTIQRASERQAADAAVRESEERYRRLIESSDDMVFSVDRAGVCKTAGGTRLRDFGLEPQDVVGRSLHDLFGDQADGYHARHLQVFDGGVPVTYEHTFQFAGVTSTDLTTVYPILDAMGNVEQVGVICRDITDRKRAADLLERRASQLSLLNEIGSQIAAILELDDVLDRAAHLVCETFGYDHVALFALDSERGRMVMKTSAGALTDVFPEEHSLPLGQGIVGWVGLHGKTLLANDVEEEPRYVNLYPNQLPTRSELSVPLCSRDQILGVLDVQSPERNAFSENDVLVIETVAQQIAIAMENARLYEQARRDSEIKTTLLQEVHHRVKNNLQIISSLLDLQADARNDPLVLQALEDSRHRVRAMALVHETLYQSEDLARLDLASYLQNLADYLVDAYDGFTSDITLQLQVDSVPLGLDRAVPCGLMISELVTNALKHAFPDGGPGEIQIAAHLQGEQVELIVRDDGVGLPADIDPETSTSLGLRLVHLLIRQLQGNLCIDRKHGTAFKILFKVPTPRSTNDGNSADSRR